MKFGHRILFRPLYIIITHTRAKSFKMCKSSNISLLKISAENNTLCAIHGQEKVKNDYAKTCL